MGQDPDDINLMNNDDNERQTDDDKLDANITEQEIRKALFKQKNGKASGPDDISAEILKASYDIVSPLLVKLYNKLFNNAEYPENWSMGYFIPIFKGGDPHGPKIIVVSL